MGPVVEAASREVRPGGRRARRLLALLGVAILLGLAACWKGPIEVRLGLILAERSLARGRLDDAGRRLDAIIERHPARPWPRFLRAQVARRLGEITEAEDRLQRAIDLGLPVEAARPEHDLLREGPDRGRNSDGQSVVAGASIRRK